MDDSFNKDLNNNFELVDLVIEDDTDSVFSTIFRDASNIGTAAQSGLQMCALQEAMDNYAKAMNDFAIAKSTGLPVKTPVAQYKGFAAEEYFKHSLKINALAKGVPDYKIGAYTRGSLPDGSNLSGIDMEVDISVWIRKHFWSKPVRAVDYQSKMHNNPSQYQNDINNAQYENVEFVGGSGQGVNDKVSVKIGNSKVSSDSITPKEAEKLAADMKAQNTAEYAQRAEKINELNIHSFENAVAVGAFVGFAVSTIQEIIGVIKNRDNLSEDQFVQSVEHIMCGTGEGALRGGAINLSVQMMAKVLGREVTASSLEAVPAMAVANFSIDLAKDLYKCFVEESIDTDDLLCNSVENLFTSAAGFGGGWIGGQVAGLLVSAKTAAATGAAIGSSLGPIGTIVGAVVGGVIIGLGAKAISNTANKNAYLAFENCINEINSHVELTGVDRIYYFANSMSSLSDHRISFKDLLPCYNLISDLKEYNLHRKAIKSISEQLSDSLNALDVKKRIALKKLEQEHQNRLKVLEDMFVAQKKTLNNNYKDSLNVYVANSYVEYLNVVAAQTSTIDECIQEYKINENNHFMILENLAHRNELNTEINQVIEDLMIDTDCRSRVKPFVDSLIQYMQQDELLLDRQYVSYDDVMSVIHAGENV